MSKKDTVEQMYKWAPYGALLVLLTLLYISNVHRVEKKIRHINRLHSNTETLKREYYSIKQKSWYDGTLNQVVKKVDGVDISKDVVIPHKIKRGNA